MKITIQDLLYLKLCFDYYRVETKINAVGKVYLDGDLIIELEGTIQYGIIRLDFYKALQEYTKDIDFIRVSGKKLMIKNEYLKDIHLRNEIELELL